MTEEDRLELTRRARTARDNAKAESIVADAFITEYRRGLSGHPDASPETHARSMQIYDFAIGSENRYRNFIRDAKLYERLLNEQSS